jgi:hypothetical protein
MTTYYENDGTSSNDGLATGPLASLFKSKYDYDSLQYPSDLKSDEKNHYVVFQIYPVKSVTIEELEKLGAKIMGSETVTNGINYAKEVAQTGNFSAGVNKVVTDIKQGTEQGVAVVEGMVSENGGPIQVAKDAFGKFTEWFTGDKQTVANFIETRKEQVAATITLYMPDTLEFNQSADYPESNVMDALSSLGGKLSLLGKGAGSINSLLQNEASKVAINKLGYAFNPQQMLLFQGIPFREFPMSFTFTAESAREAAQIQRIIREFRKHAAPTIVNASAGFFFKPPSIFALSFWSNGKINENINKVTDCVLKSVDVNYAPNGWSAHKDGKPVQITMNLNFQETKLVDRNMIAVEGF